DVPLTRRDDLERSVAPLVELDRVRDRLRIGDEVTALAEQLHDALARLLDGLARQLAVRRDRAVVPVRDGRVAAEPAVPADDRAGGEPQLPPPGHAGQGAERADHRRARALPRVR